MAQGYFLTGTDTDVGKTHVAVQLIERWRRDGRRVLAMKPVASVRPTARWSMAMWSGWSRRPASATAS